MNRFITLQTDLGLEQCQQRLQGGSENLQLQGLKIKLDLPRFKIFKAFSFNPLDYYDITRTLIFCGFFEKTESGTTIKGYFRFNYLFTYFWGFLFIVATFFMYQNSGQAYPWAPVIVFLIGCCFVGILVFVAPKNFSRLYYRPGYFLPKNIVNALGGILEIKN